MLKELAVTRFRFTCAHCEHNWTVDYDVQHVEDGHGQAWDYYSLSGSPVTAPTAPGVVRCAACGAHRVHVELIATRDIPLVEPADCLRGPAALAEPATPGQRAARRSAPLLAGDQTSDSPGARDPAMPAPSTGSE